MRSGNMDRRVQFLRADLRDNGLNAERGWSDPETDSIGPLLFAEKVDVSDAERMAAQANDAIITSRFVVRFSEFTASITPADRIRCEGVTYGITGIKEVGRRDRLEITARAGVDAE